jgi:hypothetical protein
MKKLIIIIMLLSFSFSVNTNWILHDYWKTLEKKEEKKKKIGKVFLIILGSSIKTYVVTSSIKYYRR